MSNRIASLVLYAAVVTGAAAARPAFAQPEPDGRTVHALTAPSARRNVSFYSPGLVYEWHAREGDTVRAGQPLMVQDDRIERKRLDGLNLIASSSLKIEAAQAQLDLEKVLLDRKQGSEMGYSESELLEQKVKVDIGEKSVALEREKKREAEIEREAQAIKVDLMTLKSPVNGRVARFHVGPGEMADPQKAEGAVTVVQNDPLHVEFQLPTAQSQALKVGDQMSVRYEGGAADARPASVVFIDPEALNETQTVRLEWPNPENRDSGLPVVVELPQRLVAASAK